MRLRPAVVVTSVSCCLLVAAVVGGCTDKLWLPAIAPDAGSSADVGSAGRDAGGTGGRGGPGGGTGGRGAAACIGAAPLPLRISKAEVMISLARNSSMGSRLGDGPNAMASKIGAVESKLRELVVRYEKAVNFGYQEFPSPASCPDGAACCPSSRPRYWPSPDTDFGIEEALSRCNVAAPADQCTFPIDGRPIGQALTDIVDHWRFPMSQQRDRLVILIVDGDPSCGAGGPGIQSCDEAGNAVSDLSHRDIRTHVVALIEPNVSPPCLNNLAGQAGTGPSMHSSSVYRAGDTSQLSESLNNIISRAAATVCLVGFASALPSDLSRLSVRIEGQPVDPSGPNGWTLIPGGQPQLQLRGSSCEQFQELSPSDLQVFPSCLP